MLTPEGVVLADRPPLPSSAKGSAPAAVAAVLVTRLYISVSLLSYSSNIIFNVLANIFVLSDLMLVLDWVLLLEYSFFVNLPYALINDFQLSSLACFLLIKLTAALKSQSCWWVCSKYALAALHSLFALQYWSMLQARFWSDGKVVKI